MMLACVICDPSLKFDGAESAVIIVRKQASVPKTRRF
jgi:hypothetical protein